MDGSGICSENYCTWPRFLHCGVVIRLSNVSASKVETCGSGVIGWGLIGSMHEELYDAIAPESSCFVPPSAGEGLVCCFLF